MNMQVLYQLIEHQQNSERWLFLKALGVILFFFGSLLCFFTPEKWRERL